MFGLLLHEAHPPVHHWSRHATILEAATPSRSPPTSGSGSPQKGQGLGEGIQKGIRLRSQINTLAVHVSLRHIILRTRNVALEERSSARWRWPWRRKTHALPRSAPLARVCAPRPKAPNAHGQRLCAVLRSPANRARYARGHWTVRLFCDCACLMRSTRRTVGCGGDCEAIGE